MSLGVAATSMPHSVKTAIVADLGALLALSPEALLAQRYERFRVFGRPGAQPVLPSEVTHD